MGTKKEAYLSSHEVSTPQSFPLKKNSVDFFFLIDGCPFKCYK